jgi:site-specific DNA recombinase
MFCGCCQAPMVICGGSSAKYYYCVAAKKRGTCDNKLSLREDVARTRILGALHERLTGPEAIRQLRKRIAQGLAKMSSSANSELATLHARLGRTEERVHGLIAFIADGDSSDYIRKTLQDLEAQAKSDKAAMAALKATAAKPIPLPRVQDIVNRALDLEAMVKADPLKGRAALRRYFEDGRIELEPQEQGFYIARSKLLPLMLLTQSKTPQPFGPGRAPQSGCAGKI